MKMHFLSASYEHHVPPTTTAHLTNGHKSRPVKGGH